ncbi:hypothetical protein [Lentilactobacillus sp. Marseille-Q4993]|uniref:hypothetical protein n=1 Tax=Lentilactobacillus sp. Marseille-Q4993 TaxID=3039492 RepID=UPI0024BD2C9A|nr:hypothetical protein [Lentilactobacillus sp. Marseille-Q4993]
MKKILHPTTNNIYIWGLLDCLCLASIAILGPLKIIGNGQNGIISKTILYTYLLIFLISIFKSIAGIVFNQKYTDGGILSVVFLELCFSPLIVLMALSTW